MPNRKLTVTKSNFFRQLYNTSEPSYNWFGTRETPKTIIVVCSSWRQNLEIGYFKLLSVLQKTKRSKMRAACAALNRAARVTCTIIIKLKSFVCGFDR